MMAVVDTLLWRHILDHIKSYWGNSPIVSYFDNESLNHEGLNSLLIVMQIPYLQLALSVMALKIIRQHVRGKHLYRT